MKEQELRDTLNELYNGNTLNTEEWNCVLDLFKEAGWGELPPIEDMTNFYRAWATANGYVRLAEDQSVRKPEWKDGDLLRGWEIAVKYLTEEFNFRKVIEENK